MIEALLGVVIALLVALLVLLLRRREVAPSDIEAAVSGTWVRLGLAERIGAMEAHAREVRDSYRSFEQLLRVPTERGSFGEVSLEAILADQLPPDMFAIRQRTFDGKIPDATIRSSVGVICIDSKFPLDGYRRAVECDDEAARAAHHRRFLRDVSGHLAKVAADYIRPEKGSADFAFAYVPSEAVYYFLLCEGYSLLREFSVRGVQVVSPLTLATKVELIKAGVLARRLSEGARQVQEDLRALGKRFAALDDEWQVFYGTHLRNAQARADGIDQHYQALRREFLRIAEEKDVE